MRRRLELIQGDGPAPTTSRAGEEDAPRQERGIYAAWFTVAGHRVYYAVTSAGERVGEVVIWPGVKKDLAVLQLEMMLDQMDPYRPPLRLVQPPIRER